MSTAESTSPSEAGSGAAVDALRDACDRLVQTAADPAAARALVVSVWALGAAAADDLLADLCHVAAGSAERTGETASAADLLDALGRHEAAARLRESVERGIAAHERAAQDAARAERAVLAARAAVRLATTTEHRRSATRSGARAA